MRKTALLLSLALTIGYDATTLRAKNVESLNRWLAKNGYSFYKNLLTGCGLTFKKAE